VADLNGSGRTIVMSSRLYQRRVKDVMSKHVVTVTAGDTVHQALEVMIENKVSVLPVVDQDGHCVGIVSTSDFVDVTYELDAGLNEAEQESELWWGPFIRNLTQNVAQQSVMDLMTEEVVSAAPNTPLVEAADKMLREHVHRLPVLDDKRRLVGILAMSDVLQAFVECAPPE
jgi:CBS domain-containing protein